LKAENGEIINSFTRLLNYIYKNMAQTINQRIDALRALLNAFIIPSTDPHLSEYVAPYWKSREWISGFTGSAGTAVITSDKAGLWTDSRYFLQAEQQLEGSGIDLYKEMLPETPSILDFLRENLTANSVVGIDGKVFSTTQAIALQEDLRNTLFHPARESNGRAFSLSGRSRRHHPCLWGHRILCDKNTGRQHHARHGKDELCRLFRPPPFLPGT